jgi:putative ABC transport system permease protein
MSVMLQDRPVLPGSVSGGAAGRRVVIRWARRLLRREWRQQILVLALLALTVGAAAFGVAAAYNVASLPGPQFGSANYLLQFAGTGQKTMTADIAAARRTFGTIEVIGRQFVSIPAPPRPSSTGH